MDFQYKILSQVNFKHSYFSDGIPRCFSIKPTIETEKLLLNHSLLFKPKNSGFLLAFESFNNGSERSREEVITSDKILKFIVTLNDPLFFNYTSITTPNLSSSVFHFHNFDKDRLSYLHSSENVESSDLVSATDIANEFFTKPFAIIELQLSRLLAEEYTISFKEKSTYWRYLLVSEYLKELTKPAVLNGSIVFNGPVEIKLPNNKMALAFESNIPIGIKQRTDKFFQLVENYDVATNKGKTIIKSLPQPNVNIISKINGDVQILHKEYSEIIL